MKELLDICGALKRQSEVNFALATVVHVEGSAYRRPGARMLISASGESWGMISGGCLEHDVLIHARRVLSSSIPTIVRYDSTSDEDIIFGTGLGCNGVIDVFIEPVTAPFRERFISAVECCYQTRRPGAVATVIDRLDLDAPAQHAFLTDERWTGSEITAFLLAGFIPESEESIMLFRPTFGDKARLFIQPLLPPLQLVVFGGGLDVVPLIRIAKQAGFQTIVVDSRQRPSSLRILCDADSLILCSAVEALSQIKFDSRTVAVLMNHHFECDCEALAALTQLSLPYLGLLGPSRRREKLLAAVKSHAAQISEEFAGCLHGPAGLDIGAKTPEEIALAIVAEILSVLNQRSGRPSRERQIPLHVSQPSHAYA